MLRNSARPDWQIGFGLSVFTALLFSLLPIALKGLLGGMDPITITWYRFFFATLFLLSVIASQHGFPSWQTLRKAGNNAANGKLGILPGIKFSAVSGQHALIIDHDARFSIRALPFARLDHGIGQAFRCRGRACQNRWLGLCRNGSRRVCRRKLKKQGRGEGRRDGALERFGCHGILGNHWMWFV
jgi:hypothetical protein